MVLYLVSNSASKESKTRLPSHPEAVHWPDFIANDRSLTTNFLSFYGREMHVNETLVGMLWHNYYRHYAMQQKIQPEQLGCGRPYFAAYSTRVRTATPEGAAALSQFIDRYRSASSGLYKLVRRLFQNPKNHLALYGLFLPAQAPEQIKHTWFWAENVTGDPLDVRAPFDRPGRRWGDPARPDDTVPMTWSELNQDSTYALMMVLADPKLENPSTRAARVWQKMIAEYDLRCSGLRSKSLAWIFRHIADMETRRRIGESVAALVRGHLSYVEFARERSRQRQQALTRLESVHPGFFRELKAYIEDSMVWQRACRTVEDLRKRKRQQLREEGLAEDSISRVLWAVQREAMRGIAPRVKAFAQIQPPTEEENQLAKEKEDMMKEFVTALTLGEEEIPFGEDVFRRFASPNAAPIRLAADLRHLQNMLDMYCRHIAPLSDPLKALLTQRRQFGKSIIHVGWESICRATGRRVEDDSVAGSMEARALYQFIVNNVRSFFQNLRPLREPDWPDEPDFWPRLQEGKDWERTNEGNNCWGNALNVNIRIPRAGLRTLVVAANLRGHLPVSARQIEPLDVANGLCRFMPNQQMLRIAGDKPQKTLLKFQAMRLMKKGNRILAHISATQITQLLRSPEAAVRGSEDIRVGERLAVLHLYPGGRCLGQVVLFERREEHPGWKQLAIEEIVRDTRSESYEERNGKRVHIRTQRKVTTGFVVLDETSHLVERARLERLCRDVRPQFNAPLISGLAGARTNLADTHYRQVAARIASLCAYNRIGYVLIAGIGRLVASITQEDGSKPLFLAAPTPKFFTVHRPGGGSKLNGLLINALQKAGVTSLLATARARNFWVKPYLRNRTIEGCVLAHPYRDDSVTEKGRIYTGKRTLIAPNDKTSGYPYPLNACWAILLDWSRADFSQHVDHALSVAKA
jgi:hypothetical protein